MCSSYRPISSTAPAEDKDARIPQSRVWQGIEKGKGKGKEQGEAGTTLQGSVCCYMESYDLQI